MQQAMRILVTGGTGTLGRLVVPQLQDAGHEVRTLGRHRPADLDAEVDHRTVDLGAAGDTSDGLDAAVEGIDVVVHLAGGPRGDDRKALHLTRAAARHGVGHLVFVSVVGADRIPLASRVDRAMFGYFGAKHAAERIVADSGIPWTTLRATQFHELTLTTVRTMARLPVVPVPSGFRFQPVDGREVADRLVELALGAPAGLVADLGGPRAYPMRDLVRSYLRASGKHRLLVPARMPGSAAKAMRAGANLAPDRAVGRRTWEGFLAEKVPGPDRGHRSAAAEAVSPGARRR